MRCIRFLRYHVGLVIHVEDVEGYAHGFFAEDVALYRFRKTRAGSVPAGVFGGRRPHGVLVTDRYTGYDRARGPDIPAENNRAERGVRGLLRCEDPAAKLAQALDVYASTGKKSAVRDFLFPRAGRLDCAQRQAQR